MSGAGERANGRASGPVLTSGFLDILAHGGGGGTVAYRFKSTMDGFLSALLVRVGKEA